MQSINRDSAGAKIYANFREDISSATSYTMTLLPERGDKISVTPVLETSNLTVGDETFTANYYVSHTLTDDQLNRYTGRWKLKATATISTTNIKSTEYVFFRVVD